MRRINFRRTFFYRTCLVACLIYDFSTLLTQILLIFTDKNKEKSVVYPYNPCAKVRKEVIFNPTKQAHKQTYPKIPLSCFSSFRSHSKISVKISFTCV
jgi:hypothetical protein